MMQSVALERACSPPRTMLSCNPGKEQAGVEGCAPAPPPLELCRMRGHRAERAHLSGCAYHPPPPAPAPKQELASRAGFCGRRSTLSGRGAVE